MSEGAYRFTLGHFDCVSISDGAFNYPLESLFATAPREQVEEALRASHLPIDRVATPYTCLFVNTGVHRVMIDTGAGAIGENAARVFPNVDHSTTQTGMLIGHLKEAGIEPVSIDTVIITHAHPDHIAGTLDRSGRLVFPNAHYFVSSDEWAFWMSDIAATKAPGMMVDIARRNLEAMRDRLTLVEDGAEVVPGIRVVAAPGHTPGHVALSIVSEGAQLLHISDVVLYPFHMEHPEWVPVFDMAPEVAAASKRKTFDLAAEEQALVFAHHFPPFPNLGHVQYRGEGWRWLPINRDQ